MLVSLVFPVTPQAAPCQCSIARKYLLHGEHNIGCQRDQKENANQDTTDVVFAGILFLFAWQSDVMLDSLTSPSLENMHTLLHIIIILYLSNSY